LGCYFSNIKGIEMGKVLGKMKFDFGVTKAKIFQMKFNEFWLNLFQNTSL